MGPPRRASTVPSHPVPPHLKNDFKVREGSYKWVRYLTFINKMVPYTFVRSLEMGNEKFCKGRRKD